MNLAAAEAAVEQAKANGSLSIASQLALRRAMLRLDDEDDSDVEFSFDGKNLKPDRPDRFGNAVPPRAKVTVDENGRVITNSGNPDAPMGPVQVKVTPYIAKKNPARTRERSWQALELSRRHIEEQTGQPPRFIVEPTSGLLLPRDQVVGSEEQSGPSNIPTERVHYRRSVDILTELREERMMRFFQGS